ncbi:Transducin/WD40 repeat-like superfamily protein, putative isoform 1 [Hibiscus syriacus]|uniref:Transducin/WD40 repeat-like superfamily protein, putative isoform 1 n=1 Tax=Hibiscus syriacus TaxID=106335 RepID=A0A6A3CDL8_HIBSY|nr:chaperone protein dnaJ 11, chloroplastic-like [Hibiscus syriacus]KAE8726866.1 Transducin/WD40 repeat-like superfamily protein, putative isoform 1 [Hibiscus syriacus]
MYATLPSPFAAAKPVDSFSPKKAVTVNNSAQAAASFKSATVTENHNASTAALAGSLYEILKVERTALFNEIKMAYRSLAKVYHPDAMGSSLDGSDFIEIRNAYATLSDPTARAVYDMSLGARARRFRSRVHLTRRWETDQCW